MTNKHKSTIVIKLGTKIVTGKNGILDVKNINRIVGEIGQIIDSGINCVIVSSGAIGAGCGIMKCMPGKLSIKEKQAIACVGQTDLMNVYREAFAAQNRTVGQLLLTGKDFADRKSYLNLRNTLYTLLEMGVVPVINENDSVAVEEIKFSDNDHLAALITSKIDAEKLIILTDVEGLYSDNNEIIKEVSKITDEIINISGGRGSEFSMGGMISKIKAAEMVLKMCVSDIYIVSGRKTGILTDIINGSNPGTVIRTKSESMKHKKRWIAFGIRPSGKIVLDDGAVKAVVDNNSSLLAIGIKKVDGNFKQGDTVRCLDKDQNEIARGLVNYSSDELKKILGKKSTEIENILGYKSDDEIINRDNLVLI